MTMNIGSKWVYTKVYFHGGRSSARIMPPWPSPQSVSVSASWQSPGRNSLYCDIGNNGSLPTGMQTCSYAIGELDHCTCTVGKQVRVR